MSAYIPADLRREIIEEAKGLCAYCRSSNRLMGVTFEIEHIIPRSAGGDNTRENLCLSCPPCNGYKGARVVAIDPITGEEMRLFHPRQQNWPDHFRWNEKATEVIGLTPIGRATVEVLRINRPIIVSLRVHWITLGLHPPD